MVAGAAFNSTLNLIYNSTDMNGDLLVNLTDVALFIPLLGSTSYEADYNFDGIVNLTDMRGSSRPMARCATRFRMVSL